MTRKSDNPAPEKSGEFLDTRAYDVVGSKLKLDRGPLVNGILGHYKIVGTLGVGGMGEVYLAQDTRLGRKIALKLLPSEFTIDAERVHRFEQEARAASALSHPNVCVIHEIGDTEDGRRFITMEYIEGITLRQRLGKKRLKLMEALDVAAQVAAALAVAHAAGIVHRDIKPENVMLRLQVVQLYFEALPFPSEIPINSCQLMSPRIEKTRTD